MENEVKHNGHAPEADEELFEIEDRVKRAQDGIGGNLQGSSLGLLKMMLSVPKEYEHLAFFTVCRFKDDDERRDHVDAFMEAKDIGLSTDWNVANMLGMMATEGSIKGTYRVSELISAIASFKYITNKPEQAKNKENRSAL